MKFILCAHNFILNSAILALIVCIIEARQGFNSQNKVIDPQFDEIHVMFNLGVNNYFSDNIFLQSNLLISPIMGKTNPALSELSFEYSNESIRGRHSSNFKLEPSDKILDRLFDPQGVLKHSSGILRYGFFNALFSLLNEQIKNSMGLKYVIHPALLNNSLSSLDCVNLLKKSNKHFNMGVLSRINVGVFKIACDRVTSSESILEMSLWKNEIIDILKSIKEFISLVEKYIYIQKKNNMEVKSLVVPKVAVTGTEIKQRYIQIVSQIERIKRKEPALFGSLIFTKKMAIKISTQYISNGDKLVWKCIEIIKQNNPALMREKYQEGVIKQICKVTMGN
ncbi:hypothetical protein FG379_000678 [Cryptosporidium bovis]|uniref:uncharacterized protein n=1 Tax=Cryptosporidium bovis TaxID=310047 RepID=UPI00351A8C41|nr:hypothetical protein FG379_000678 [Cryptosporidium bovis]